MLGSAAGTPWRAGGADEGWMLAITWNRFRNVIRILALGGNTIPAGRAGQPNHCMGRGQLDRGRRRTNLDCAEDVSESCRASCHHLARALPVVFEELSAVRETADDGSMPTTARRQRRSDHRLRHLVQRTGDVTVASASITSSCGTSARCFAPLRTYRRCRRPSSCTRRSPPVVHQHRGSVVHRVGAPHIREFWSRVLATLITPSETPHGADGVSGRDNRRFAVGNVGLDRVLSAKQSQLTSAPRLARWRI
jgi:hypothetical protein